MSPFAPHSPGQGIATELAVEITNVTKTYESGGSAVSALKNVDLRIGRGERVALLGKSGSGKSTLLNLLGGLDWPTSGTIRVSGSDLHAMHPDDLARFRLKTVGMIFQAYNLVESRTALENVELPMIFAGRARSDRQEAAREALRAVGLDDRGNHRPSRLSGGERQRVAIARALVNKPSVILADEPTGNLDTVTARGVLDVLMDHLEQNGTTLILVTHDEELARLAAARTVRLRDGRIVEGWEP